MSADAEGVRAFYRDRLMARGWEEVADVAWQPSDAHNGRPGELSAFRRDPAGPMFLVAIAPKVAGISEVHVRVASSTPSPCASPLLPHAPEGPVVRS